MGWNAVSSDLVNRGGQNDLALGLAAERPCLDPKKPRWRAGGAGTKVRAESDSADQPKLRV
jgi:hypothetical protein